MTTLGLHTGLLMGALSTSPALEEEALNLNSTAHDAAAVEALHPTLAREPLPVVRKMVAHHALPEALSLSPQNDARLFTEEARGLVDWVVAPGTSQAGVSASNMVIELSPWFLSVLGIAAFGLIGREYWNSFHNPNRFVGRYLGHWQLPEDCTGLNFDRSNIDLETAQEILNRGGSLKGVDLTEEHFRNLDSFHGIDLRGAHLPQDPKRFSRQGFNQTWLDAAQIQQLVDLGVSIRGVCAQDADLSEVDLSGVDVSKVDLRRTTLPRDKKHWPRSFAGAILDRVGVTALLRAGVTLKGVNLRAADLSYLRDGELVGQDLRGALLPERSSRWPRSLRGAILDGNQVAQISEIGKSLAGTDLSQADLSQVQFYPLMGDVNLRGAQLPSNPAHWPVSFARTRLDAQQVRLILSTRLPSASAHDWMGLAGADMGDNDLSGEMDFSYECLAECSFENTNLQGADFRGADLAGAIFMGANVAGADFRGAIMTAELRAYLASCGAVVNQATPLH